MKKFLISGAIAALLALPACGRKSVEKEADTPVTITETRVEAREVKGAALKRMFGYRAKRLGKRGINTVHFTIQNGGATNLVLGPDGTGLDIVPAKEVARITSRSVADGLAGKIARTAGALFLVPFAFILTAAGITELLKATGIVSNPFPGGTGIIIPIAGYYIGIVACALVGIHAVGTQWLSFLFSRGNRYRNQSPWNSLMKQVDNVASLQRLFPRSFNRSLHLQATIVIHFGP